MPTEIVPLTPELLPALLRFATRVWTRPDRPDFRAWRYEAPAFHCAFLAMRDGECLAAESAFRHPYRVGDEVVEFLEVFDWYCLPELQNTGLGVRVMQRFMKEPNPLLLLGGTPVTQGLLPRLGWKAVERATRWSLPIGLDRTARALERRAHLPAPIARAVAPVVRLAAGRRPRRRFRPPGGRAIAVTVPGPELYELQRGPLGYGTVPIWTPELLHWLIAGFPGIGHFVPFEFTGDGRLRGFALLRIHPGPEGCGAEIVDLFAPAPDADLYAWMISELVAVAEGFAAEVVAFSTSCAAVAEAARRNGFVETPSNPIQVWWPGRETLPKPILLGSNTGDSPILPLPEAWPLSPDEVS